MRSSFCLVILVALSLVAGKAQAAGWVIQPTTDAITGAPASVALLCSSRTLNSARAVTPASILELGCFKGKPAVAFVFEFDVGTTKDSEFGYRFDKKSGHQIGPRFLSNHSTVIIEAKGDVAQFVSELAASNALFIQIRSLTNGQSTAEFDVAGAKEAIAAAFAGCPLRCRAGNGTPVAHAEHAMVGTLRLPTLRICRRRASRAI